MCCQSLPADWQELAGALPVIATPMAASGSTVTAAVGIVFEHNFSMQGSMGLSLFFKLGLLVSTVHLDTFPEDIDSVQPLLFGDP